MEINNTNLPEEVKRKSFVGKHLSFIIILAVALVITGGLYAYASYIERNSVESVTASKVNQQTPSPVVRLVSITPVALLTTTSTVARVPSPSPVSSSTKVPAPTETSYLTPKQITDKYSNGACGTKLSWEGTVVNVTGFVFMPYADFRTFPNLQFYTDKAIGGQWDNNNSISILVSENLKNQTFADKLASLHNENVNVKITLTAQDFPTNGDCNRGFVGELSSSDDIIKI